MLQGTTVHNDGSMGTVHALHPHRLLHTDLGLKTASVRSYHPCYSRLRSERHVVAVRTFPSIPMSCQILILKIFYREYFTKSAIQNRNFAQNPDAGHTGNLGPAHRRKCACGAINAIC